MTPRLVKLCRASTRGGGGWMLNRGVRGGLFNRRPITFVYFDGRPITFVYFDGRPITFVYFGIDEQRRSVGIKGRGGGRRECGRGEEGSFIKKNSAGGVLNVRRRINCLTVESAIVPPGLFFNDQAKTNTRASRLRFVSRGTAG